jgi:hypothetical protein
VGPGYLPVSYTGKYFGNFTGCEITKILNVKLPKYLPMQLTGEDPIAHVHPLHKNLKILPLSSILPINTIPITTTTQDSKSAYESCAALHNPKTIE